MYTHISIILLKFSLIYSNILAAEKNFEKPKLEHNIVNKGVWVRNKFNDNLYENGSTGDFLFRANSLDVDNILQNNFNMVGENDLQDTPFVSSYFERAKRSTNYKRKRHLRKSMKNCKNKIDCGKSMSTEENNELVESKLITNLKPLSVYNDYIYEDAILLNNNKEYDIINNDNGSDTDKINLTDIFTKEMQEKINKDSNSTTDKEEFKANDVKTDGDFYNVIVGREILSSSYNNMAHNVTVSKRNNKHDYYNEEIKNIEFVEDLNRTDGKYPVFKTHTGIFDQQKPWKTNGYIQDVNVYKVDPKMDRVIEKSKPVTERGLIKVISILTKTLKKVMKHHNEIKDVHERLINMNIDFVKNLESINEKFQSFEEKYLMIMKFDEKLKDVEKRMKLKEDYFKKMQQEMSKNLMEFANQQKNFASQQKQFYTIQKLMLAQNEKINIKQNLIVKTQSEISHRQNNFARILKKAKQLYLEAKNPVTKLNLYIAKPKDHDFQKPITTTPIPVTEYIKINLFSIPTNTTNKLAIEDDLIIKEKDEKPIDDLVYKYYFNNTFIDNLIKSKILTSVITSPEEVLKKSKNKRNGLETTLLLPINDSKNSNRLKRFAAFNEILNGTHSEARLSTRVLSHDRLSSNLLNSESTLTNLEGSTLSSILTASSQLKTELTKLYDQLKLNQQLPNRPKRWINHTPNKNHKHQHEKSYYLNKNQMNDKEINLVTTEQNLKVNDTMKALANNGSTNPFLKMATKFCVEIGQNVSEQVLSWCVEKTLRRLRIMDMKHFTVPPAVVEEKIPQVERNTIKTDTVTKEAINAVRVADELKITEPPILKTTAKHTVVTEAAYLPPMYQITNQDGQQAYFPDNQELESNIKQFDLTRDPEGNVYYDGSLHASDIITGPDRDGDSDVPPGFESNSQMEIDPYTLYLQAMRRASVRKINENILKNMKI